MEVNNGKESDSMEKIGKKVMNLLRRKVTLKRFGFIKPLSRL